MMLILQSLLALMLAGPASQAPPQDAYAGAQECATCHEDTFNAFRRNVHVKAEHSCESCHGPAREHTETADIAKIRSFKSLKPRPHAKCLAY